MLQLVKNVFGHHNHTVAIVRWTVGAPPLSREAASVIELFDDDTLCIEIDDHDIEHALAA